MAFFEKIPRREFLRDLGLGLAAGWTLGRLAWPLNVLAGEREFRLVLLADAHLKNGDGARPEAQALARAVAEIRALSLKPDLVLFAGDLAHRGRPDALDLGREILSDLPAPQLLVRGEGDGSPGAPDAWTRRFGASRFSYQFPGCHLLGLDTRLRRTAAGPEFALGPEQIQWLARELDRLDPATPLLILSHAPLSRIYHPWQHWTADAVELHRFLTPFRQVLCIHGHVHGAGVRGQGSGGRNVGARGQGSGVSEVNIDNRKFGIGFFTENGKQKTENRLSHLSLPATAWPRPQALQGTPATPRPGVGPQGCGWTLLTFGPASLHLQPQLWQV